MRPYQTFHNDIETQGFITIPDVYTSEEVDAMIDLIIRADTEKETFRKSAALFAIRQFLKELPEIMDLVFNTGIREIISTMFRPDYFVVKSIYFDKPEGSNWYVAYHQDLTISVDRRLDIPGFGPWTVKQNQFAVQPPLDMLENNFTIRIHLDDTDADNGALKVVTGSHLKGIYRPENIDWSNERESVCDVPKGGVMIMKPLLLHSSSRTTNGKKRRVIHLEFSHLELPEGLRWSERVKI
ncbi:phytanoyl-CoA dioxygenase family protein [Parapedobacter defluvii]|uniref:phytanoyl-CoA dioxygenase family protein n=1 Tax=Parapedobacter defluvii TaxID=2045106 RepID=UPI0033413A11